MPCVIIPPEGERRGGAMVRLARESRSMSLDELARAVGCRGPILDRIERSPDVPRIYLAKLSVVLDFPPSFFEQVLPADEGVGFLCGKADPAHFEACRFCGHLSTRLCDWPMGDGKTCDVPLCDACAYQPEIDFMPRADDLLARREPQQAERVKRRRAALDDLDYCPTHAAMAAGNLPSAEKQQ